MIPLWAIGLLKNKWTWIMAACGVLFLVSFYKIVEFGNERYKQGQMAERVIWETVVAEAVTEQNRLRRELVATQAARDAASAAATTARNAALAITQEQIRNATTVEDQYTAYRAHHDSVRNESASNLARARADYLSSLSDAEHRSPANTGSPDVGSNDSGSVSLRDVEGSMVGYGLGQR